MLNTGSGPSAASSSSSASAWVRTPTAATWRREHARGVAQRLAADELQLVGTQHHRVAAQLDDAGLEATRACGSTASGRCSATERPSSALRGARRGLERGGAVEERVELVARQLGAGEEVALGKPGMHRPRMRVLSWNLFHGRAVPERRRSLLGRVRGRLAGWDWDVALLQEVPPWWPAQLARASRRAAAHRALTSRNALLPLRRARRAAARPRSSPTAAAPTRSSCGATRSPRMPGGGCASCPSGASCTPCDSETPACGSPTSTRRPTPSRSRAPTWCEAGAAVTRWAGGAPVASGRRLQRARSRGAGLRGRRRPSDRPLPRARRPRGGHATADPAAGRALGPSPGADRGAHLVG